MHSSGVGLLLCEQIPVLFTSDCTEFGVQFEKGDEV